MAQERDGSEQENSEVDNLGGCGDGKRLTGQLGRTDNEVGWNAGEAFAYLIGDLEDLNRFELSKNLVTTHLCQSFGGTEEYREPILFWSFIFEFDNFLTGLMDCVVQFGSAKRNRPSSETSHSASAQGRRRVQDLLMLH